MMLVWELRSQRASIVATHHSLVRPGRPFLRPGLAFSVKSHPDLPPMELGAPPRDAAPPGSVGER